MFLRSVFSRIPKVGGALNKGTSTTRLIHSFNHQNGRFVVNSSSATPTGLFGKGGSLNLRTLGGVREVHDTKPKGDDELLNFLAEEIATEKKTERPGPLPTKLDGFDLKLEGSEVTLKKSVNNEEVTVTFNVNHTVDAEYADEMDAKGGAAPEKEPEMRSKPNFEIEILKGGKVLSFSCSFLQDTNAIEQQQGEEYQDAFIIDEISIYEGEWREQVYAVAGDILDGYLYDLFMNMLEERGVTSEFVEKMSDLATDYEHKLYINLLGQLQNFLTNK